MELGWMELSLNEFNELKKDLDKWQIYYTNGKLHDAMNMICGYWICVGCGDGEQEFLCHELKQEDISLNNGIMGIPQ